MSTISDDLPYYTCFECQGEGYYIFIRRKQITINDYFYDIPIQTEGVCKICHGRGKLREDEYVYQL